MWKRFYCLYPRCHLGSVSYFPEVGILKQGVGPVFREHFTPEGNFPHGDLIFEVERKLFWKKKKIIVCRFLCTKSLIPP